ncbi:hypothetical protein FK220_012060 [Flavobacteriaceae bacterium TP-CH-4]|uniref:OmpA family protein n=1 Tax=Pelagihabitans pacificus TaxID=2696054 RepID=A0A967AUB3_9FLAO|nr:hypothetical protein [Pelagihabitans pacificus]NHF60082.1 hypothetical protein [Pelagihabitans pacificus]
MRTFILLTFLLCGTAVFGQKKSELFAQIESLKSQLDSVKGLVSEAKKNERISKAKAESFESQVLELQDANATLLKNLSSFAEVSNKNSENINNALASLSEKEAQLKDINDAIASNDSTAIVVLTNAKQSLGENARVAVSNGAVVISESLESLFGDGSKSNISAEAEPWLGKIAGILKANPKTALTIEGLSMTGELDLAAQQAATISSVLQKNFEIDPNRIMALGKDGNFKEGINFKIHPKFDEFYLMVRENMRNAN